MRSTIPRIMAPMSQTKARQSLEIKSSCRAWLLRKDPRNVAKPLNLVFHDSTIDLLGCNQQIANDAIEHGEGHRIPDHAMKLASCDSDITCWLDKSIDWKPLQAQHF